MLTVLAHLFWPSIVDYIRFNPAQLNKTVLNLLVLPPLFTFRHVKVSKLGLTWTGELLNGTLLLINVCSYFTKYIALFRVKQLFWDNLQECITAEPLIIIATNNGSDHEVERALSAHRDVLGGIVVEADELRVKVLKELIRILTPLQGIHLLVASNRLHLSIHEWGKM